MLKCDRNNSNLTVQLLVESHSLENSRTLIGYLGEVFSVDLRLLKARLCVIFHFSDNKTTSEKQSTVGKKMADVHFTTIPCEPNTAYEAQRKPNFHNICQCTKDIV